MDEKIYAEDAAIALLVQPVAELSRHGAHSAPFNCVAARKDVVSAPAALIGRQFREPGDVQLHWTDERAVTRGNGFQRAWQVIDPAHHLQFPAGDLIRPLVPIFLGLYEERRTARISVWELHDEVGAEPLLERKLLEARPARCLADDVGNARYAGVVAELGGDDFGINMSPELCGRQRNLLSELACNILGLLIEHDEQELAGTALLQVCTHLLVTQEVVVDVLDGPKLMGTMFARDGDLGMRAIEAVEVVDVIKVVDPTAKTQEVVGGRRQQRDRRLVLAKVGINLGESGKPIVTTPHENLRVMQDGTPCRTFAAPVKIIKEPDMIGSPAHNVIGSPVHIGALLAIRHLPVSP